MRSADRPMLARPTLVLVIGGFVALAGRAAITLVTPTDVLDEKLAGAQKYLYYRIAPDTGPEFALTGSEQTLQLVTHVELPAGTTYDPTLEIEYGVRVEVDVGDGTTWKREVHTRSRQSK